MYVSNSFKKYDGYKALIILEVISILNIQKDYCSRFTKNIRCINCLQPCPHKNLLIVLKIIIIV